MAIHGFRMVKMVKDEEKIFSGGLKNCLAGPFWGGALGAGARPPQANAGSRPGPPSPTFSLNPGNIHEKYIETVAITKILTILSKILVTEWTFCV